MPASALCGSKRNESLELLAPQFNALILPARSVALNNCPPIERTTIDGDPTVGTIHYFRQTHSIYTEGKPELIEIGRFQREILQELEQGQFLHVFAEGLVKNFNLSIPTEIRECGIYHFNLLKKNAEFIGSPNDPGRFVEWTRELFSSHYPALSADSVKREQQLITLGILGAHFVFACMNPRVTLHRTISPALDHKIFKRQEELEKAGQGNSEEFRKLRFVVRENIVMKEIAKFLKKNPGESVAVIFGLYHSLIGARDQVWERPPVLEDISFVQPFREYLAWKAAFVSGDELRSL